MSSGDNEPVDTTELIAELTRAGLSVATAESLTGGGLCAELTSVAGSSAVVRGGVVCYATDLKAQLAGVPTELLAERGPVDSETAAAMAAGVRERLHADIGVATTGVAGPDPQDGHPVGEVYIAACLPGRIGVQPSVRTLALTGDRDEIRRQTVRAAISLIAELLGEYRRRAGMPG